MPKTRTRLWMILALTIVGGASSARPLPNAFLNEPALTREQLVGQAADDPAVMDRYQRHFGLTRAQTLEYLRSLRLGALKQTGRYTVYNVPESGVIRMKVLVLKKGERVWFDPSGRPVLVALCGNPMTLGPNPPGTPHPPVATIPMAGAVELRDLYASEANPVTAPEEVFAGLVPAVPPMSELETSMPGVFDVIDLTAPATSFTPAIAPGGPIPLGGLLAAGVGIGAFLAIDRGGGGQPVPEPMGILALGAGIGWLFRRRVVHAGRQHGAEPRL